MIPLRHYRSTAKGVADLLNYAALVDDGVVLNKDGSLLAGFFLRGPDSASMTADELNQFTAKINAIFRKYGDGWAMWCEVVRMSTEAYLSPVQSEFPDTCTRLIEAERRRHFEAEGSHFESETALIIQYTPPLVRQQKLSRLVYDDIQKDTKDQASRVLVQFQRTLAELEDELGDILRVRRLGAYHSPELKGRPVLRDELVNFLQRCLTGLAEPLNLPPIPMYLDALIGGQELHTGDTPKIGENYLCCIGIEGFPQQSFPGILDYLGTLPLAYRWSTRLIFMDQHAALASLAKYRRKWKQRERGFTAQVFRTTGGIVNEDALLMTRQTEHAMTDAQSALVTFLYMTSVIVLSGPDRALLSENAKLVSREIRRAGFAARVETVNATEAWLGSLPGHAVPNIRRPLLHTLSVADILSLNHVWSGSPVNSSPMFPAGSAALLQAAAEGSTPFRLNLHVGDVGHTLVFGPTGAGKSTLLGALAASFRRYPGAMVTCFDKGRSMFALAKAIGGRHYEFSADAEQAGLCPLAGIDTEAGAAWAEQWLATCIVLQTGTQPTPRQKDAIHQAIRLLRQAGKEGRTLTDFVMTVQDQDIRDALRPYTGDGPLGGLLDSVEDGILDSSFTVFELEELMGYPETVALPVLLCLFRRFERSLTGAPALLILDEAWVMLGHPVFREKVREWLKTLRKANCAVVLATQSLSDAVRSGLLDVLLESCPTRILLPNEEANKPGTEQAPGPRDFYTLLGLNETEIRIVQSATKKRHYYYMSPEGRRLFDLALGPLALSFVGVSSRPEIADIRALAAQHGEQWPLHWLEKRGVAYADLL
jgi:type IV secretion system protein VirB4